MMSAYLIQQCNESACRFRFPMREGERLGDRCPRCGGRTTTRHVIAEGSERPSLSLFPASPTFAALLDNVRSLFNVGSIFRSADGAAFRHLYLCGVTPTPANRKLAKTALGAEQSVAWSHHNNSVDLADALLAGGQDLWALEEGEQAESIFAVTGIGKPAVLVVGNEVTGVDPDLLARCTRRLAIPMHGKKRSLNVATAFGIAAVMLSELCYTACILKNCDGEDMP